MVGNYLSSGFLSPYKFASDLVARIHYLNWGVKLQGPLNGWMVTQHLSAMPWSLGQEDPLEKEMAAQAVSPMDRGAWKATVHERLKFQFEWSVFGLLCRWKFSGNTGADCHFLFQGISPSQTSNHLQYWQADSLTTVPPGKVEVLEPAYFRSKRPRLIEVQDGAIYVPIPPLKKMFKVHKLSAWVLFTYSIW